MGVPGLFPLVEYARERVNLRLAYKNKTIAVDTFVWLHRFVAKHALEVVVNKNFGPVIEELVWRTRQYTLRGSSIIHVFDGKRPVAKSGRTKPAWNVG